MPTQHTKILIGNFQFPKTDHIWNRVPYSSSLPGKKAGLKAGILETSENAEENLEMSIKEEA